MSVARRASLAGLLLAVLLATPGVARARPVLSDARCFPADSCVLDGRDVVPGDRVVLRGTDLRPAPRVLFLGDRRSTVDDRWAPVLEAGRRRVVARVPAGARSGLVVLRAGAWWSNAAGPLTVAGSSRRPAHPLRSPFDGQGMWVWYVSKSAGGRPGGMAAVVRRQHLSAVHVKVADGTHYWAQVSRLLVATLRRAGAHTCAWQYVYGYRPEAEASVAAAAIRAIGADCFVIDAEIEVEGHWAAMRRYVRALRARVGPEFPVGVAGWPYADHHPGYPLSELVGPDGAQWSMPQVYWKAIGDPVEVALSHTWAVNTPYGRPLAPIGQSFGGVSGRELRRFRALAAAWGAGGVSWWSWQATPTAAWGPLRASPFPADVPAPPPPETLGVGARGDVVVWLQQHLDRVIEGVRITGVLDARTRDALESYQELYGLPVTGVADPRTWAALDAGDAPADEPLPRAGAAALRAGPRPSREIPPARLRR